MENNAAVPIGEKFFDTNLIFFSQFLCFIVHVMFFSLLSYQFKCEKCISAQKVDLFDNNINAATAKVKNAEKMRQMPHKGGKKTTLEAAILDKPLS